MKTLSKTKYVVLALFTLVLGVGCTATSKLPSVTLGGAANHKSVVGVSLNKEGLNLTAPLVDVDVPFPSASVDK